MLPIGVVFVCCLLATALGRQLPSAQLPPSPQHNPTINPAPPHSSSTAHAPQRKRESPAINFPWRTPSKPKFVTGKMQKVEPILKVYPPDVVYRSGRGRDLTLPQQPGNLKRVIYYATLPEISRYVPPMPPNRHFAEFVPSFPVPTVPINQQRSYDPNKAGKDFVTRVQSTVIGVHPRPGDKKKDQHAPSFTIIDASPVYPDPFDRIAVLNGAAFDKDKYHLLHGYVNDPNQQVEQVPHLPQMVYHPRRPPVTAFAVDPALLYYSPMRPYHPADAQKLVGPPVLDNRLNLYTTYTASSFQNPPPYPTRHNRFPSDRYPPGSPLAAILGAPGPQPPGVVNAAAPPRFQPGGGGGADGPPTTTWVPTSSLELGGGGGDGMLDQPLDGETPRPLSYKNKFAGQLAHPLLSGSPFGQKYTDFGTFNTNFAIRPQLSPQPHAAPFKPHFSQVSDWLTNKPSVDLSAFELEDFNNALASNAAATAGGSGQESSSSPPTSTSATADVPADADQFDELLKNNTIITPYLASFPNTSSSESQDD